MGRSFSFVIFLLDTGKFDVGDDGDIDIYGLTCSAMMHAL
jgi:hypothetical protein